LQSLHLTKEEKVRRIEKKRMDLLLLSDVPVIIHQKFGNAITSARTLMAIILVSIFSCAATSIEGFPYTT
jgi:hypothetical protein